MHFWLKMCIHSEESHSFWIVLELLAFESILAISEKIKKVLVPLGQSIKYVEQTPCSWGSHCNTESKTVL